MPLVGVIDPRGEEALPHPGQLPPWYTPEQMLNALAVNTLGESHWTYEMANAALANVQERGDMISTTAVITGCPRSEVLKRKEDYVGDLNELWAAMRGTLMHRTLELWTPPGAIPETRFFTHVDGIEMSCQPDLITRNMELIDYKVPAEQNSIPMTYLYKNQTEQLMFNAFVVRHSERWDPEDIAFDPRDHDFNSVGIVFIGPKRPKVMVYKQSFEVKGPSGKTRKVRLPYVWNDAEVLKAMRPRLHLFANALQSYPDWPQPWTDPDDGKTYTAEEVWGGDQSWNCPGWPACKYTTCLAKRRPSTYVWEQPK